MSKFIKKKATKKVVKKEVKKVEKPVVEEKHIEEKPVEVIKKETKEFVECPKCGWKHTPDTTRCRFCGAKIGE